MTKLAIIQNGDCPQIESSTVMLRAAGYEVKYCGGALRQALISAGCDTVLSTEHMEALGYDKVDKSIGPASIRDMETCDLFCEIKVRNIPKITEKWPRLKHRICYWRVNGAQPEICPKGGDEVNLPCPAITACLWYGTPRYREGKSPQGQSNLEHLANREIAYEELLGLHESVKLCNPEAMAYVFWPPYPRSGEYDAIDRRGLTSYADPYCLCHSVRAWGYGGIVSQCVDLGVKFYGNNSPHGQVSHRQVPGIVAKAKALVHLKSVDCPGWALYEAILGGCPVITGRLLNSRMLGYGLLEDEVTCYEFGVPASLEYGRGPTNEEKCLEDIRNALEKLSDSATNRRIGEAGRKRLNELMWCEDRDGDSFRAFVKRYWG